MKNNNHFKIVTPFYNVEKWIGVCIKSIKAQKYKNFQCILIDDISKDGTSDVVRKEIEGDSRFVFVENKEKKLALKNIYDGIEMLNPKQEDIIVTLDGDDWFASPDVLDILNDTYNQKDCFLTYGSYAEFPSGRKGKFARQVPESIIENSSYRTSQWMTSHLRTFKYKLWDKIEKEDLLDQEGNFYKMTWDLAFMFPMLEMSAGRSCYIDKILYIYNQDNPLNDHKVDNRLQMKLEREIRSKKKYKRLK
jgi:glycosyltransferase involved in cell wall biosynthesis